MGSAKLLIAIVNFIVSELEIVIVTVIGIVTSAVIVNANCFCNSAVEWR